MIRCFISFLLFTSLTAFAQQKKFIIYGDIPVESKKYNVLLSWNNGNDAEEANVVNGKFTIKGTLEKPSIATLTLQEVSPKKGKEFNRLEFEQNSISLFIDTGVINVSSKNYLWNAEVQGSPVVNDYQTYLNNIQQILRLESKMGELYDNYMKASDQTAAAKVFELYKEMLGLYTYEQLKFVKENPSSIISLYLIKQALGSDLDASKAEPMYVLLSTTLQNSEDGKVINNMIELGKKSMIGVLATDFSQPDVNGNMISLSSFKGKYVLVDFWASWCGPCRVESPNLVKAYSKFKEKNFEIFGVSLDKDKAKWLKAIKDDNYTWPQVGDMNGWENAAAQTYAVQGIPFNILIDPNGVIIGRSLRGEALEKKLEEILK